MRRSAFVAQSECTPTTELAKLTAASHSRLHNGPFLQKHVRVPRGQTPSLKTVSWPTRPSLTWRCGILRAPYSSHPLIMSLQHCRTVQRLAQAAGHPPAPIGSEAPTAAAALRHGAPHHWPSHWWPSHWRRGSGAGAHAHAARPGRRVSLRRPFPRRRDSRPDPSLRLSRIRTHGRARPPLCPVPTALP